MIRKIWILALFMLLVMFLFTFFKSPFIHSAGIFAQFEKARAIPALILGLTGTILLLFWGWILLRGGRGSNE